MTTKQDIVRRLVPPEATPGEAGEAFAPANIALCKYWGKRDEELNLPVTSSLSISLANLGSRVRLTRAEKFDVCALNGEGLAPDSSFSKRASAFLDMFRPAPDFFFRVEATNTIPTAAGFASSASGFAALILAVDRFFKWNLEPAHLSILARLGSGSAARSLFEGFVEWEAGTRADGMDSLAAPLSAKWPELRVGLLVICDEEKKVGSRAGMRQTVVTSTLYRAWPEQVARDLAELKQAIEQHDFTRLGETAEANALAMHATMIAGRPPVLYWKPESVAAMHRIWSLRAEGLPVHFTMDAGPNLKLLFEAARESEVCAAFPGLRVVSPFGS